MKLTEPTEIGLTVKTSEKHFGNRSREERRKINRVSVAKERKRMMGREKSSNLI